MKISRIGGVIAAASKKDAEPLLQIGTIPIIKRIVISFQQAGIFPIVVVTGAEEDEVKYQLSSYGVIFIRNENCEQPELIDSVKIGLKYLLGKCDRRVFTPVNVPMFTPATLMLTSIKYGLRSMPHCKAFFLLPGDMPVVKKNTFLKLLKARPDNHPSVLFPTLGGYRKHPPLIDYRFRDIIMQFEGEGGLRQLWKQQEESIIHVPVDDDGVWMDLDTYGRL